MVIGRSLSRPRLSALVGTLFASFVIALAPFAAAQPTEASPTESPAPAPAPAPAESVLRTPTPRVHHAPLAVAESGAPLLVRADIEHPELVKSATLVYQTAHRRELRATAFQRGSEGPYVAIVPAEEVVNPWLAYAIELERVDGTRIAAFASRASMHLVEVPELVSDLRERALTERLDGRRSAVTATTEYVRFGARTDDAGLPLKDEYYRVEAGYTYRPLRTVAEFSLRGGVVRTTDTKTRGLNYGAPTLRLRLDDAFHLELEFLTSVTDKGFAVGTGAALLIGDPYGSKLTLGFESIEDYGSRVYSRLDLAAHRNLLVSPVIEVTNMPYGDRFGVRLLVDVRCALGAGFSLGLNGGYQARVATSGGPAVGTTVQYAF